MTEQTEKTTKIVIEKLDSDLEHLKKIFKRLWTETNVLTNTDTKCLNNILSGYKNFKNFIEDKLPVLPINNEEVLKKWQEWELYREFKGYSYCSSFDRNAAARKIMELAEGEIEKFSHILDYAMAFGYVNVYPELLTKIEIDSKSLLFKESPEYNNRNRFLIKMLQNPLFKDIYETTDFDNYFARAESWSLDKGVKSKNWTAKITGWITKDVQSGKLAKLTPDQINKQTITGERLKKIWSEIINDLAKKIPQTEMEIFNSCQPVKIFKLILTVKVKTEEHYKIIEETYFEQFKTSVRKTNIIHTVSYIQ